MLFTTAVGNVLATLPAEGGSIFRYLTDVEALLTALGPWVLSIVVLMVFIESGVLFPFLPGDSLVFTAGLLHTQLGLNLWLLVGLIFLAAVAGDQVGYWLGRRFGRRFFADDARVLKTQYLHEAEDFFRRYGGRSLVLARFVPLVRTFTPLAAGLARYQYRRFLFFNLLGALMWGVGLTLLGASLGHIAFIRNNIEILAVLIVFVSLIPMGVEIYRKIARDKKAKRAATEND